MFLVQKKGENRMRRVHPVFKIPIRLLTGFVSVKVSN
jgi:hypothetical protein